MVHQPTACNPATFMPIQGPTPPGHPPPADSTRVTPDRNKGIWAPYCCPREGCRMGLRCSKGMGRGAQCRAEHSCAASTQPRGSEGSAAPTLQQCRL